MVDLHENVQGKADFTVSQKLPPKMGPRKPIWRVGRLDCSFGLMCFSAGASFVAAGVTGVTGIVTVVSATRPAHVLLAAIPLFFASHQVAEGLLWLALADPSLSAWQRPAMFGFLAVGKVVWPVIVPLAILAFETVERRRRLLRGLSVLGLAVGIGGAVSLLQYPVSADAIGSHIRYSIDTPLVLRWAVDLGYPVVTALPPLVSSNPVIRRIGWLVLASFLITKLFWYEYFISVWCFFAAFFSALILVAVRRDAHRGFSRAAPR